MSDPAISKIKSPTIPVSYGYEAKEFETKGMRYTTTIVSNETSGHCITYLDNEKANNTTITLGTTNIKKPIKASRNKSPEVIQNAQFLITKTTNGPEKTIEYLTPSPFSELSQPKTLIMENGAFVELKTDKNKKIPVVCRTGPEVIDFTKLPKK